MPEYMAFAAMHNITSLAKTKSKLLSGNGSGSTIMSCFTKVKSTPSMPMHTSTTSRPTKATSFLPRAVNSSLMVALQMPVPQPRSSTRSGSGTDCFLNSTLLLLP